jgi:hypothetical protein
MKKNIKTELRSFKLKEIQGGGFGDHSIINSLSLPRPLPSCSPNTFNLERQRE